MRKVIKYNVLAIIMIFSLALFGCSKSANETLKNSEEVESSDLIVVGFSQVGAESVWRNVNSQSMKETFTEENGYSLIFEDGQQKQSNQIMAIRKFIQQEVDYIVLAPVTETGWDTVLMEAKQADIPVIIVDRMVDVEDESLYTCWVGSDFELEGKKICTWIHDYCEGRNIDPSKLNVVNIQGNLGASAQIGRTRGLKNASKKYGWNILKQVSGDFTKTKGRNVMKDLLKQYKAINVVYCENDSMALGAIEALEEAGKKVGSNIKIGEVMVVSFDGVDEETRQFVRDGKISCIAECNPHHGPRVKAIIEKLEKGIEPPKLSYVIEEIYVHDESVDKIAVDNIVYPLTIL